MSPNVNSPAKAISDLHLSYARLICIKRDMEELLRLGHGSVTQVMVDGIQTGILEVRNQIVLLD